MLGERGAESGGNPSGLGGAYRSGGRTGHGSDALIRELSIAQAIVDVATCHARGRTVAAIELHMGREREAAPEGIDFAFSLLTEGTSLDGAELEIEQVAGAELAVHALRLNDARVHD